MECTICTEIETAIQKSNHDHEKKLELEKKLEEHWRDQEEFRNHYSDTITKSIANQEWDLCLHVDGGSAGSEYSPYYVKDVSKGEPFRHKCMKVCFTRSHLISYSHET